jgi:hypothetical protein
LRYCKQFRLPLSPHQGSSNKYDQAALPSSSAMNFDYLSVLRSAFDARAVV